MYVPQGSCSSSDVKAPPAPSAKCKKKKKDDKAPAAPQPPPKKQPDKVLLLILEFYTITFTGYASGFNIPLLGTRLFPLVGDFV